MSEGLKACPFCGHPGEIEHEDKEIDQRHAEEPEKGHLLTRHQPKIQGRKARRKNNFKQAKQDTPSPIDLASFPIEQHKQQSGDNHHHEDDAENHRHMERIAREGNRETVETSR